MNPLHTEFKRKFAISMYKNMGIPLGEMSFWKDFVNDTRGDLYPILEKSDDCSERVASNRYYVLGGRAERLFCQFFPYATYELQTEAVEGEVGFVFRLPTATASVTLVCREGSRCLQYRCGDRYERIALPEAFTETAPWLVSLRPGCFDVYYRQNEKAEYLITLEEQLFVDSNCYAVMKDSNVSLLADGEVCVARVTSVLDNGVSIADIRAVRYEDGTVIHENGRVYFTASIRAQAGSYQAIFAWVPGTAQLEMTGALFFDRGDGYWRNYLASVLLYHRSAKKWYVWTSSFEDAHVLAYGQFAGDPRFGVCVADVQLMPRATEGENDTAFVGFVGDEDPDLIYDAKQDRWLLAICRIDSKSKRYVYVFFESHHPFEGFRYIGRGMQEGAEETGGAFVLTQDGLCFVCGNSFARRSEYRIYNRDGMREARFRYPDGGFRGWGCIIPVCLGSRMRYFWLTFDRHNGSCYNWSYGNFYCFEAE